ncbi:MAG: Nucleoside diphosphate kinase [Parcubacteria group bacterium GW2011_GWA2_44_15]|nr:MAG: Nucleoside diphosphate kinase [Parcubacteria group bacterium GW2011_GWA2_44_15]
MANHKQERTLVLIKPDGVLRGLIGECLHRFEQRGLKVIALKMVRPSKEKIDEHYPKSAEWIERLGEKTLGNLEKYGYDPKKELGTTDKKKIGEEVRAWIMDYMTMAPIVAMVVEGVHAIDMVRKIVGATLPVLADMGTIRGDFSVDSPTVANIEKRSIRNLIHASETPAESAHEIAHWFEISELHDYKRTEEDMMP